MIYALLVKMYPKEHYKKYGPDMCQLFNDQCNSVKNLFELIALWFHTLGDLIITLFKEHLTSPTFSNGLLDAPANAPMPWKGVFLVLFPGLVFFIGQAGQLNGEDWFFWLTYRGAYYLMIPVILVWVWTKKFPVWGLIPLGLLFKTLLSLGSRLVYLTIGENNPLFIPAINIFSSIPQDTIKIIIISLICLMILVSFILVNRMKKMSRGAWIWLGAFLFLILAHAFITFPSYIYHPDFVDEKAVLVNTIVIEHLYNEVYFYGGFLALILGGVLLARRHGRLAALLPLGYLLPTVLYGRISNEWPDPATAEFGFMFTVGMTALVYRFLVALVAPLWVVRSATSQMKRKAGIISLVVLIMIQLVFTTVLTVNTYTIWPPFTQVVNGNSLYFNSLYFMSGNIHTALDSLAQHNSLNAGTGFFAIQQIIVQSPEMILIRVVVQQLLIAAGIGLALSVNRLFSDDLSSKKEIEVLYEGASA